MKNPAFLLLLACLTLVSCASDHSPESRVKESPMLDLEDRLHVLESDDLR